MSRNGSGIYSLPSVYKANTGDLIVADQHNSPLEDIKDDLNAARPIVAGGTGATTASGARTELSVPSISDVQTGYVPKVASKTALSALDTASFKAAVVTEATREKLWMWKAGDFSTEEAADTDHVNYIAADGVSTSLGCWVAATGDGVTVRPISGGGTGASNASDARHNLGLGSAATSDTTDFATAAQGALADSALQDATDFATAAQGTKADTAAQKVPFALQSDADGATIDSGITHASTVGYATIDDGGGAEFALTDTDPEMPGGWSPADGRFAEIIPAARYKPSPFGILPEDDGASDLFNDVVGWMERRERWGRIELLPETYYASGSWKFRPLIGLVGLGGGQYPRAAEATSSSFVNLPRTRLQAQTGFSAGDPIIDASITRGDPYCLHGITMDGLMIDCAGITDVGVTWRGLKNSVVRDLLIFRPTANRASRGAILDTAQGAITSATAQAGSSSSITLAANSCPRDDWYNGATVTILSGTGVGQSRTIADYVGSTNVASVETDWTTTPDATSVYSIDCEVVGGSADSNFNLFERVTIWLGSTGYASGWEMNGDGIADPNQNTYLNCHIVHANGPGIRALNGDSERFYGISTYAFGIGSGLLAYGSDIDDYNGYCRDNTYTDAMFGGANAGGVTGTAQSGASTYIQLASGSSSVDGHYTDKLVTITSGTGVGQTRQCVGYNGTTGVLSVKPDWTTAPDATSVYSIPNGGGAVLLTGTYADSTGHKFPDGETRTNGASAPTGPGAWYSWSSALETFLGGSVGHILSIASQSPFQAGNAASLRYKARLAAGALTDFAKMDGRLAGTAGSEIGYWDFYTRVAGSLALTFSAGNGGVTLNSGVLWKRHLRAATSLDFPSIPANSESDAIEVTVTGAKAGDVVHLGLPFSGISAGLMLKGVTTADDTVSVYAINATTSAIDPPNLAINVIVMGY